MKPVAIILSGCGVFDGAEIHESVFTMYGLAKRGVEYVCFAPDIPQMHVVNHLTGEVVEDESRNVLVESARIARGEIKSLSQLDVSEFSALVVPGGFGAAKNLCDFAVKGAEASVNPDVLKACKAFAEANKPAGYACIAPSLMSSVYGTGVKLTIGNDADTASALEAMGAQHIDQPVTGVVLDDRNRVVSTPAYMLAQSITEAADSIDNLIENLVKQIS
ncbi:isoprenoid biosynthesis glyoxalase ElbB [Aestuariibacter sp. AA17]|uniref:Glyoxalase n=1 Tax=Fluctibacter corallii TaxID=2984329 RepID=A0ABT3AD36_9ALTE|nr:isoprenoid biosynthesis glyoxalase ElbB [Aestuariibacter sp. AA17]MCV2886558.1 isoprenoid biosynthesis glyoxalase ElbB [Aestuariibacter sp. AA17]